MKKKILTALLLAILMTGLSGLFSHDMAKADDTAVGWIEITSYPSKTVYTIGERLDMSDMVITGFYSDGSSSILTDYTIDGYDSSKAGTRTITVNYHGLLTTFQIRVVPPKISGFTFAGQDQASHTLSWNSLGDEFWYEVYKVDEMTGGLVLVGITGKNSITLLITPGTLPTYRIGAVTEADGTVYKGELSDPYTTAARPGAVTGLSVTQTSDNAISLAWNGVPGATGYIIYRSGSPSNNFKRIGVTAAAAYTDGALASGTGYKYKVSAYLLDESNTGDYSPEVNTGTNPARITLRGKAGDQKVMIMGTKAAGANYYKLYIAENGAEFTLLATIKDSNGFSYMAEGLSNGKKYSFYATAHRENNGSVYDSMPSDIISFSVNEIAGSSTTALLFPDFPAFQNSWAYSKLEFFGKNVDFQKSYIIPGLSHTNAGGFPSTSMCPQGITFAGDYLLMTAYDIKAEENSVVYVIDKASQELVTTLLLPTKAHVGGIAFDGINIWITVGSSVASIKLSKLIEAVSPRSPYAIIGFDVIRGLGISASYITYYDRKLWVGSYNELKATNMYGYSIKNREGKPSLKREATILMPDRVQGIAFTDDGYFIISRSCQLYLGLRGYMRQLDVYKPDLKAGSSGNIKLGNLVRTVEMPSMNEGIAVDGAYLYVNFESGAFANSSYKMDRICAFRLDSILGKRR